MKVGLYPQITQILNKVTNKFQDKQGGAGQNAYQGSSQKKKDSEAEDQGQSFEQIVDDEKVQAAISAFSEDSTNKSNGISASMEGHGPGLKVILKDAGGGVLRAVSGEEFLKLREATKQGKRSGRILDQKI